MSKIKTVTVDSCNKPDKNAKSDCSIQPETSKMTPKELRVFMHRSPDDVGEVLCSHKKIPKTLKQRTDNTAGERFSNKKYQNEDTSNQVVSKNMKHNNKLMIWSIHQHQHPETKIIH